MPSLPQLIRRTSFVAAVSFHSATAYATGVDPEDQKLIDAASCDEIIKQYSIHVAQEKAVAEEIRRTSNSTTATNVFGVATMATLGIGFFTWDNNVDNEANLAELRAYRDAIGAAGRKKGCALPAK